jgi:hypothetical protein
MRPLNEHLPTGKQQVQRDARIAQSVEQRIENPRVGSSILSPGTIYSKKPVLKSTGFFVPDVQECSLDPVVPVSNPTSPVKRNHK